MENTVQKNTADWYCQKIQESDELHQQETYREVRKVATDIQIMGDMIKAVFNDGSQMIFTAVLLR